MTADERLAEAFDRGMDRGEECLSPADRELFLIESFILEYEMSGLAGYLYNRLPDSGVIFATVEAMSARGLSSLATLLGEAASPFRGYADPDPPSTWDEVCRHYDPAGRLGELDDRIAALESYNLEEATFG